MRRFSTLVEIQSGHIYQFHLQNEISNSKNKFQNIDCQRWKMASLKIASQRWIDPNTRSKDKRFPPKINWPMEKKDIHSIAKNISAITCYRHVCILTYLSKCPLVTKHIFVLLKMSKNIALHHRILVDWLIGV